MLSCVSPTALHNIFNGAPSQCPKCYTPLLQGMIQLEADVVEEQIFFCVTCRKDVANNDGKLDCFFEQSKGSMFLLSNPFEGNPNWASYLREKLIPYVVYLAQILAAPTILYLFSHVAIIYSPMTPFLAATRTLFNKTPCRVYTKHLMKPKS